VPAELAHGNDHQRLYRPGRRARLAISDREGLPGMLDRHADGRVGEVGKLAERLLDLRPAGQGAPCDTHHLTPTPASQGREHVGIGAATWGRRASCVVAGGRAAGETIMCAEIAQQLGVAGTRLRNEVTGRKDARERAANEGRQGLEPPRGSTLQGVQPALQTPLQLSADDQAVNPRRCCRGRGWSLHRGDGLRP
jgi:hypothetical protein